MEPVMSPVPPSLDHLSSVDQLVIVVRDLVIAQGRTEARIDDLCAAIGRQVDTQAAGIALVSRVLDAVFGSLTGRIVLGVVGLLLLGPRAVEALTAIRAIL
jgi:hypothetical protein